MSHDLHNTPSLASEYDEQPQLLSASIDQGPSDHLNAVGTSGIDPVVRQLNPKQPAAIAPTGQLTSGTARRG